MKRYSLKELLEMANDIFKKLNVEKVFATNDGQFFVEENRALLHATPNKLSVFELKACDASEVEAETEKKALNKVAMKKDASDKAAADKAAADKAAAKKTAAKKK